MTRSLSTPGATATLSRRMLPWLYPRLRELPHEKWQAALDKARGTEFATSEWIGIVGGTCFTVWLLDMETAAWVVPSPLLALALQFFFALPLLALVVGPFLLRRTRRGLDRELARRGGHGADASSTM